MIRKLFGPEPRVPLVESYIHPVSHQGMICIAGPCSVESQEHIFLIASKVKGMATHLRGGLFRAGTYPSANYGWTVFDHSTAAAESGLLCIEEWVGFDRPKAMPAHWCVQIGARQMQNYDKLREAAQLGRPVFLKRHWGATLGEFLGAAEYLLKYGCTELYLIERGSRINDHTRWAVDVSMIPAIHAVNPDLRVIVDASHGTGRRDIVPEMTFAGLAAGADGFLVEVHDSPGNSISDAEQAYPVSKFKELFETACIVHATAQAWKRKEGK